MLVHRPRFVFLPAGDRRRDVGERPVEGLYWLLMAPNNRHLGRSLAVFPTYAGCRAAVDRLRREHSRVASHSVPDESTGQFGWRVDLDGETVAVSSRSYLRARECEYNLTRFLDSVPEADVASGAHAAGRTRAYRPRRAPEREEGGVR